MQTDKKYQSTQKSSKDIFHRFEYEFLQISLSSNFNIELPAFQQISSESFKLLHILNDLHKITIDLKDDKSNLEEQIKFMEEEKGDFERYVIKKEEKTQKVIEALKIDKLHAKADIEALQKEMKLLEIKKQALENDFKKSKNEQKEKSYAVIKASLKSGLFINGPIIKNEKINHESIQQTEHRGMLKTIQDFQMFKKEFYSAGRKLAEDIDREYSIRQRYLLECLKVDGFNFSHFEVLKKIPEDEQFYFTGQNAVELIQKCSKMNLFYKVFDKFLSARFEKFLSDQKEGDNSAESRHVGLNRFIHNDFSKISDMVYLQTISQNYKNIVDEHMSDLELSESIENLRSRINEKSDDLNGKSILNRCKDFKEKVDKIMDRTDSFIQQSKLAKEDSLKGDTLQEDTFKEDI